MTGKPLSIACMGAMVCGLSASAWAESADTASLQAEVAALRSEVAQLRQSQDANWLNERRAEEVKGLIREVLSDAQTRQSLLQDGITAGHNGSNFFLASNDGSFLLNIGGQVQFRWIANHQNDRSDEDDSGFQVRRTKLKFGGHIADPRIGYDIVLATDYRDGNVFLEDVVLSYDLTDNLEILAGKFKLPFLREELVSSSRQLTVERSSVNEYFTLNRAEQIQLVYTADMFRVAGALSDGANSETSDYNADTAEIALTGRVDVKLAGEWDQEADFTSWSGEPLAVFVGGAVHYETGDAQNAAVNAARATADYFSWTIDGQVEYQGANLAAAFIGGHVNPDMGSDFDMYGFVVQGGYNINDKLEPFIRWEWIDDDAASTDDFQALTFGANYYLNGHAAKFSADLVWVYDGALVSNPFGANPTSTGLGLGDFTSAEDDDVLALRAQFQLLF